MCNGLMIYGPELWMIVGHIILIVIEVGVFYFWGYHDGYIDKKAKLRGKHERE
jgi:hypothetical protein